MIYDYYLDNINNPISKKELKNKLGNEFSSLEAKIYASSLKHIYRYDAHFDTSAGHVIVHNVTILRTLQMVLWIPALISILISIIAALQNADLTALRYTNMICAILGAVSSAVITIIGFKNDERRIVDITSIVFTGAIFFGVALVACALL